MTPEPATHDCYTDFALQEFIAGRLDAIVRGDLALHLESCAECRKALAAFEAEARVLCSALNSDTRDDPETRTISDETLSLYLIGALDEPQAAALDIQLTSQPKLLNRLLALRSETTAACAQTPSQLGPGTLRTQPRGLILTMPKRQHSVTTLLSDRRAAGGNAG